MALKLAVNSTYSSTQWADGYWRPSSFPYNDLSQTGNVVIYIFKDQATRLVDGKQYHTVSIQVGVSEILGSQGECLQLAWADVWEKTKAQLYAKLKTLKVLFEGTVYDLSTAEDV